MGKSFTTAARDIVGINFDVDGEEFTFFPPKAAAFAMNVIRINPDLPDADERRTRAMLIWFGNGLDPDHEARGENKGHNTGFVTGCQACRIEERLDDPRDGFELTTLTEIMNHCFKEATGRPPTSPGVSSPRRTKNGQSSTAGQLPGT